MTKNSTSFQPNNQAAVTHGAEGAYNRLKAGQSFLGIVQDTYIATLADLANGATEADCRAQGLDGRDLIELARFEAVNELIWQAMNMAAAEGNLERFLTLAITRFSPIAGGALKRRQVVRENRGRGDNGQDYERILEGQKNGD